MPRPLSPLIHSIATFSMQFLIKSTAYLNFRKALQDIFNLILIFFLSHFSLFEKKNTLKNKKLSGDMKINICEP